MGASSTPVSVTVCAVLQFVAVKVSVFWSPLVSPSVSTVPSVVSELATPSTTSLVGLVASFTVNAAVPPDSVVRSRSDADGAGDSTSAATSSSVMVSDAPVTVPAPWLFCAVPATVTALLAASTSLSTAVIVTVSALVVEPAAITIVASEPTV